MKDYKPQLIALAVLWVGLVLVVAVDLYGHQLGIPPPSPAVGSAGQSASAQEQPNLALTPSSSATTVTVPTGFTSAGSLSPNTLTASSNGSGAVPPPYVVVTVLSRMRLFRIKEQANMRIMEAIGWGLGGLE